jgi:hypothetical protein
MNFTEFKENCLAKYNPDGTLRLGQHCFYQLDLYDEELCTQLTGSYADPYYDDSNINIFWAILEYVWKE